MIKAGAFDTLGHTRRSLFEMYEEAVDKAIVDKNVVVPDGAQIGVDLGIDRERFTVSEGGVVAIGKGAVL